MPSLVQFLVLFLCSFGAGTIQAQTIVWQETFDGTGNWGTLNQSAGAEGCNANPFFISCAENGNPAGICGSGCGANNTLHVGSVAFGDVGAAYDAGGGFACGGLITCLFGGLCNTLTNRRSTSANINTTGFTNIDLEFDYIETGSGSIDNAYAEYSINSGSTWNFLSDMPKTNNSGCGGQGRWTHIIIPLPAACENIATLRIAFRWQNNNDGVGTDPSFAVNDVQVTQPSTLPVELISFSGKRVKEDVVQLEWTTATETNNEGFEIWRRVENAAAFTNVGWVAGNGSSLETIEYVFNDNVTQSSTSYYFLRQVDHNGASENSEVIAIAGSSTGSDPILFPNPAQERLYLSGGRPISEYQIVDAMGRVVKTGKLDDQSSIRISGMKNGLYSLGLLLEGVWNWERFQVLR